MGNSIQHTSTCSTGLQTNVIPATNDINLHMVHYRNTLNQKQFKNCNIKCYIVAENTCYTICKNCPMDLSHISKNGQNSGEYRFQPRCKLQSFITIRIFRKDYNTVMHRHHILMSLLIYCKSKNVIAIGRIFRTNHQLQQSLQVFEP